MSTVATIPSTSTQLSYATEIKTFYRVVFNTGEQDKEGNPVTDFDIVNEKVGETTEKEGTFKGHEVVNVGKFQALQYFANGDNGQTELTPDESERTVLYNRGISTKQDNKFRQMLKSTVTNEDTGETEWEYTDDESVYDMREDLKVPSNRRLTASEKFLDALTTGAVKVSSEDLQRAMALLQAQLEKSAGA